MSRYLPTIAFGCALCACGGPIEDAREREVVGVLVAADEPLLVQRPALVASKYRAMAADPFAFLRGSFPLYLHDARTGRLGSSQFWAEVYPFSIGDAHVENFGTLRASDGTFAMEPNDFDAADRYPYLWEVRRLAVALVVAVRQSNPADKDLRAEAVASEREDALAFGLAYARAIKRLADSEERPVWTEPGDSPVLIDAFERSIRDEAERRELGERTEVDGDQRRLRRGAIDEDDPHNVYFDVSDNMLAAVTGAVDGYRATLLAPPEASFFQVKDVVREYGSGVASIPRLRMVVLVEGPSGSVDDDVLLELKELADTPAPQVAPPGVNADTVQDRIVLALETCWTRRDADPLWGVGTLLGLPIQIKGDFDAYKTLRVRRLEEERGTPEALLALSANLGELLATVHAGSEALFPGTLDAIAGAIREGDAFSEELADVALDYADQVATDHALFVHALSVLGPTLGLAPSAVDRGSADQRELFGDAPEGGVP